MTIYDEIKGCLERSARARERKNKNKFLAWFLEKKYMVSLGLNQDQLANLIVDAGSYDRAWRKILQENPELRGKDYDDKEVLEQEKQLELGYMPGETDVAKRMKEKI